MLLERLHKRLHAGSSRRSQENKDKNCKPEDALPIQPEAQHQTQDPQPLLNCDYDDMIAFDRNLSTPVFTPLNADITDPIPLSNTNSNPNVSSTTSLTNTLNWYSLQRSNVSMKNRNGSSQYISELQPQPILARTNSNNSVSNSNAFSLLTPTPTTDSAFNFNIALLSRQRSNIISSPLASTRLPTANVSTEESSILPNESLKLKRDLLRLKR
ncbi:BJ4_G0026720.mRNA.1.CDS.1 [Saccharomyces cerevisiae]|nr:BJ4_G0026720.mRNA.1.CDS.1 [Saccharomyces cerevisiae]